ncbi:MAG: rhodanese-like domain-containing protein [Gammaproteobacteria bacterium]|nr:rhodanese-like domain-containing protein [Gammaproteobacteria bacterium]
MDVEFVTKNWYLFLALIVVVALIVLDPIRRRASGVSVVSATELPRLINHESAIVVDISDVNDYKKGHVPNAINIPLDSFSDGINKLRKHKSKPIVVACRAGNRAARAASILRKEGFESLYTLSGGFASWEKENLPVEK